jgi:hypothetical protein
VEESSADSLLGSSSQMCGYVKRPLSILKKERRSNRITFIHIALSPPSENAQQFGT